MQAFAQVAQARDDVLRAIAEHPLIKQAFSEEYRRFRASMGNPEGEPEDFDFEGVVKALLEAGPNAQKVIGRYAHLLFQMFLTRAVDNFLLYLAELLLLMYRTKLGVARSGATDAEEFIERLAEQYVERTSIGGMQRLAADFKNTFG